MLVDISKELAEELTSTAEALADAARDVILPYFRQSGGLEVQNKLSTGFDPVTAADKAAEQAMRAVLATRRPDDAILGEEFGHKSGSTGMTWVLDPIDGTRAFMSGTATWGVLIAVSDETGPRFGMIDQPYTGERFRGGLGMANWQSPRGGGALCTRTTGALGDAILFTTFPEVGTLAERAGFEAVRDEVQLVRYGMDCYAYALLAMGQIDLVIEAGLQAYDIQGPLAVIQGAGGIVTNWQGGPAHDGGRVLAAANPSIHAQALEILKRF
ncbi:histidinol phosphatase-like enzyme (inositol monophosphatase family) [Sagittula marina]|uniref:Histidinol phosphatase-like enzyme (Inositol monophosphatase family) n=1 Tax=Sagittula marina TaxID=943940 RepID=A0A7W6DPW5_9RHOB|nr:inositol monophosphatase family protein [Sagittula marina]MBB3984555.1 histidinol phosphatase-like enzyme (inositol monophosphatase family) [Sagittula marina]